MEELAEQERTSSTGKTHLDVRRALHDPPGGLLMWIVVGLELAVFALVFGLIAYLRASDPALFAMGQAALDPTVGLGFTITLLTSGFLAAEGVHAFRDGRIDRARGYYAGAVAFGVAFVALKVQDYAGKLGAGFVLGTNDFWDAYLLGTGFHFAHVLVGLGLLAYVGASLGKTKFEDDETTVAGIALFWHMCDIAWFFLFPLFYLR
jgi:nitric oxide reductase NorE protein